jgi:YVTN family beta-propeller protein
MAAQAVVRVGANPLAAARVGGELWVPCIDSGTVSVVDGTANAVRRTITVGPSPIAVAQAAGSAWLSSEQDGDLWRFDAVP